MDLDLVKAPLELLIAGGTIANFLLAHRAKRHGLEMKTALLELQLNLKREMNGRYVTLDRFDDLQDRVKELEHED